MPYYVYIMASQANGTLYVGITIHLFGVCMNTENPSALGFTKRHNVDALVYFKIYGDPATAIQREKNMKHWKRDWKIELIERGNPYWSELFDGLSR